MLYARWILTQIARISKRLSTTLTQEVILKFLKRPQTTLRRILARAIYTAWRNCFILSLLPSPPHYVNCVNISHPYTQRFTRGGALTFITLEWLAMVLLPFRVKCISLLSKSRFLEIPWYARSVMCIAWIFSSKRLSCHWQALMIVGDISRLFLLSSQITHFHRSIFILLNKIG